MIHFNTETLNEEKKASFRIAPSSLSDAFVFKLPSKDYLILEEDLAMDYFVELQLNETGN